MEKGCLNVFKKTQKNNSSFICICILSLLFSASCKSTNILDNGGTTTDIRDGISELENNEFKSQRTEFEITESSKEIERTSSKIDRIIYESAEHYTTIDRILQQVRNQTSE